MPDKSGKSFHDSIYGNFQYPEEFEPILRSKPVRRLMRIRQLGMLDFIYPNGDYNRFSHSIGVMYLMGIFMDKLLSEKPFSHKHKKGKEIWRQTAMLSGLFHDLGHGPLSHSFEEVAEPKHEEITRKIVEKEYIAKNNPSYKKGLKKALMNAFIVLKLTYPKSKAEREKLIQKMKRKDKPYFYCISRLLSGSFDLDKLDYLQRDLFNVGFGTGAVDFDWLRANIYFHFDPKNGRYEDSFLYFNEDSCTALEEFLFQRVAYYWKCIHHRKADLYGGIAVEILKVLKKTNENNLPSELKKDNLVIYLRDGKSINKKWTDFLEIDDSTFWELIKKIGPIKSWPKNSHVKNMLKVYSKSLLDNNYKFEFVFETKNVSKTIDEKTSRKIQERIKTEINKSLNLDHCWFSVASSVKSHVEKEGKDIKILKKYSKSKPNQKNRNKFFDLIQESRIKSIFSGEEGIRRYFLFCPNNGNEVKKEILKILKLHENDPTK